MAWSKEDKSFKTLINKRGTSSSKGFYEETGDFTVNIHGSEIWVSDISSTPSEAVSAGVAELRDHFTLTEDTSVASQQCYYAFSGSRLKDWISDKYGTGYKIRLFDNNNIEIFPTDASTWIFDYQTGILTFSGSTASFAKPFKVTGYRYIGVKGVSGGSSGLQGVTGAQGATGLSGLDGSQGETGSQGIQGVTGPSGEGSSGLQGVTGLSGDQGVTGLSGSAGDTGIQGATGLSGLDGSQGVTGLQGLNGSDGATGLQGPTGETGSQGITGLSGLDGSNGITGLQGETGLSGSDGATGVQGLTGLSGLNGETGSQGIQGETGAIGAQGVTGLSGLDGSQGITGLIGETGSQGIQGVTGPSGLQGVTGLSGLNGSQGETGSQGLTGLNGETGSQGITGLIGETGPQGSQGTTGLSGFDGVTGLQGATGASGVGETGSQGVTGLSGDQGVTGLSGSTGDKGIQGETGLSGLNGSDGVTGLQGATGISGDVGQTGIQGLKGDQGETGLQGLNGSDGSTGSQGVTGLSGLSGETGAIGLTGLSGIDGSQGETGLQGLNGSQGETGLSGLNGSQGETGLQGFTGLVGETGSQGITGLMGETGLSGLDGSQGETGLPGLNGSQGETGVQGITGLVGQTGIQGTTGLVGETGSQGITGLIGETGVQGVTGLIGASGVQGITGLIGETGSQGSTGIQGITGLIGETGSQGTTGFVGETGIQGITGLTGETGTQGITGLIGEAGPQGITGLSGNEGSQGVTGLSGLDGSQGITGLIGETGSQGLKGNQGTTGLSGNDGSQGVTGLIGETGPQGPLVNHSQLLNMPDNTGVVTDHDVRLTTKVMDTEPSIPVPFTGMLWMDLSSPSPFLTMSVTEISSGPYNVQPNDEYVVATSGTFTINLPEATGSGRTIWVKNLSSGIITIDGYDSDTIDGSLTYSLSQYSYITLCDYTLNKWVGTYGISDGATGYQGMTGSQGVTGISGAETADVLPLGTSYSDGIFAWETATMTSDALDDTNKLLLAIAPSPPNPLSGTLTLSNTVKYNAILPTGLNSAWYQDGKVAGDTISDYVIDGTYNLASPNTSTDFKVGSTFGGDVGAVRHVEDGSVVASRDVSSGAGVTDSIEIIAIVTHNTIWRRANARINYTQTTEGYKNHVMSYLLGVVNQTTSATKIWFDDQDLPPTFSTGASIVQNNLSSSRYLSGVRYYSTGDTFNITCAIENLAYKAIRPTNPISYIMTGINAVNVAINGSSFAYNATYNMSASGVTINASNAYSINATVSITATKPSGKTQTSSSSSQNRLVNTYSSTYSTNCDIYMVDERYRWTLATDFSAIPGNPSNPTGNWNSSTALTNGNAILYNSVWDYPTINFTSGYLPAQSGNDYSAFSGDQVAVWAAYIGLSHSSMSIVFTGIAYTAISAVGTGNLNIELRLPSESDWLDTGKEFGDGNGCRLGSSSGSTLNVSFGTLTSTDSSGVVFIRVTLKNMSAGKASRMQISGT